VGCGLHGLGGMKNDSIQKNERGEEGAHPVQGGNFAIIFDACRIAVHRHPSAATGMGILRILAISGQMPVDHSVKDKPANACKDALAEAHRDRHGGPHRAHPDKQIEYVL